MGRRNIHVVLDQPLTVLNITERVYKTLSGRVTGLVFKVQDQGTFKTTSQVLRRELKAMGEQGITPPFKCRIVQKGNALHFADVVPIASANQ